MKGKKCVTCGQKFPLASFYKHRTTADGLRPSCKKCLSAYSKARWTKPRVRKLAGEARKRYLANPRNLERQRVTTKAYRTRPDIKEKIRVRERQEKYLLRRKAYFAKWSKEHRDLMRKWNRDHYYRHHAQELARLFRWRRSPDGKAAISRLLACRRAAFKSAIKTFTGSEWDEIRRKQRFLCNLCGKRKKLTIDHIHPISKGGHHTKENIQALCGRCNSSKGNKTAAQI